MLQTILLVLPVIVKLWPIAREVYQMVADPDRPEQPEDALDLIIDHSCQLNPLGARASRPQRAAKIAALPGVNLKLTQMHHRSG